MKTNQPYPEELKIEAAKQITERGHRVVEVSARIGVSQHSLYKWIKTCTVAKPERQAQATQAKELRRLKAELKRATEERYILERKPPRLRGHDRVACPQRRAWIETGRYAVAR